MVKLKPEPATDIFSAKGLFKTDWAVIGKAVRSIPPGLSTEEEERLNGGILAFHITDFALSGSSPSIEFNGRGSRKLLLKRASAKGFSNSPSTCHPGNFSAKH